MSRGADPNAPTRVSAEALMALYRDEDMIEWHEGRNSMVRVHNTYLLPRRVVTWIEPPPQPVAGGRNDKRKEVTKNMSVVLTRERRRIVREMRQTHFATGSSRQLEGTVSDPAPAHAPKLGELVETDAACCPPRLISIGSWKRLACQAREAGRGYHPGRHTGGTVTRRGQRLHCQHRP